MTDSANSDADALSRLQDSLRLADPARNADAEIAAPAASAALAQARALRRDDDARKAATWLARHWLHLGRHRDALDQAAEALQLLPPGEQPAVRMEALRVQVLAASELALFEPALDAAQALMALAIKSGDAGQALTAAVAVSVCFERMGDSWQAVRLLSQALSEHGEAAPELSLLTANNALCAVCTHIIHILRDTGADEERAQMIARGRDAGERAMRLASALSNSVYQVVVQVNLGEILLAQDEVERATQLLCATLASAQAHGLTAYEWYIDITLGEARLRQGSAADAATAIDRVLAAMGDGGPPSTAARAHHVAYKACKALGRHQEALAHFERAERIERSLMMSQMRAQSQLFVTRTEAQSVRLQAEQAQQEARDERERAARSAADAERDPLTGLGNRRLLERRIHELMPLQTRDCRPLVLAQIDVDHFKRVNDQHGHAVGDAVLVALAQLLRGNSRAADVLVRLGGEEFLLVFPDTSPELAVEVCERLRQRVEDHRIALADGSELGITISIGVACAPPYDLDVLMNQADAALYAAKHAGRNRLCRAIPDGASPPS